MHRNTVSTSRVWLSQRRSQASKIQYLRKHLQQELPQDHLAHQPVLLARRHQVQPGHLPQARQVHLHSKRQWRNIRPVTEPAAEPVRMYTKTKEMVGISENSQTVPTTKRCTSLRMDFTFPTKSLVLDLAPKGPQFTIQRG